MLLCRVLVATRPAHRLQDQTRLLVIIVRSASAVQPIQKPDAIGVNDVHLAIVGNLLKLHLNELLDI